MEFIASFLVLWIILAAACTVGALISLFAEFAWGFGQIFAGGSTSSKSSPWPKILGFGAIVFFVLSIIGAVA